MCGDDQAVSAEWYEHLMREHTSIGSGREVLFFHAALSNGAQWDDVLARTPPGVRATTYDLPSFGYDAPEAELASIERSLAVLLETKSASEPVTVVGHSLGAWLVARALATRGKRVRRALLISGMAALPRQIADAYAGLASGLEGGALQRDAALPPLIAASLGAAATAQQHERLAQLVASYPDARLHRCLRLVASAAGNEVAPFEGVATTVVHGQRDAAMPLALGQELAAAAGVTLDTWDTDSHFLPLTHPERVAALAFA